MTFVVQNTVNGSVDQLKEYVLGREVFDRGPDYDPRMDSIVRTESQRLRRKLREYYQAEGATDPVLITFQAGSYVPTFAYRESISASTVMGKMDQLNPRTVAVLPFLNLSPEPDQDYFCDGVAEDVIQILSRSSELRVIGRSSAFAFKNADCDLREVGAKLAAGTLVEGSVRKSGNQLRISVEMVDSVTGHIRWSHVFDVTLGDVFTIQEEIADAIATVLRVRLVPGTTGRLARDAPDISAYLLCLKARQSWNEMTVLGYRTAIGHFERAISLYPDYASLHAGLADAYCYLAFWGGMSPRDAFPKAQKAALEALRLDKDLAHAYSSAAGATLFGLWDFEHATEMAKRATYLEPSYAFGQTIYGFCLLANGKREEALQCFQRTVDLDPLSVRANRTLGWMLGLESRYAEAEQYLLAAVTLAPDSVEARCLLADLYVQQGRISAALEQARQCQDNHPEAVALGTLGVCFARSGQSDQAAHVIDQLLKASATDYVDPHEVARIYLALGDPNKALVFIQKMVEERSPLAVFLECDPVFKQLRSDPRFNKLLQG
jgi:serine/threonine-protein kinase